MNKLLYLDLSNNSIEHVSENAFQSLTHLLKLTLQSNKWKTNSTISGIFTPMSKLRHLDLGAAFMFKYTKDTEDGNVTVRHISNLERLFNGSNLSHLVTLHLENNGLLTCSSSMFSAMPNLTELWLNDNSIGNIVLDAKLLPKLQKLHIENNAIQFLSSDVIANFVIMNYNQSLRQVNISNNPFECSCHTRTFIKWMQMNISKNFVVDRDQVFCQTPRVEPVMSVKLSSLDDSPCHSQVDSVHRVSYFVLGLILVSAVVVVVLCLILRNRQRSTSSSRQHRGPSYLPVHDM
jgi:Leucine-rich repeat (LRR) protein